MSTNGIYGVIIAVLILVFASTVFCKQHVLIDIAGGIAVAEIGLLISSRILRNYLQR